MGHQLSGWIGREVRADCVHNQNFGQLDIALWLPFLRIAGTKGSFTHGKQGKRHHGDQGSKQIRTKEKNGSGKISRPDV